MGFLVHFLWGLACSFFGTLPFGTVNVSITEASIQKGVRVGISMAAGASVVLFFQSYVALSFFNIITSDPHLERTLIIFCIPVFMIIGVFYLFKKNTGMPKATNKGSQVMGVAKGFLLSALNLVAILYYVFIGGYLANLHLITLLPDKIASFSFGAVIGSFLTFALYAKLGEFIHKRSEKLSRYASRMVGIICIVLAISQAIRFFY